MKEHKHEWDEEYKENPNCLICKECKMCYCQAREIDLEFKLTASQAALTESEQARKWAEENLLKSVMANAELQQQCNKMEADCCELQDIIKQLQAENEKLKCCGNCFKVNIDVNIDGYDVSMRCDDNKTVCNLSDTCDKWQSA